MVAKITSKRVAELHRRRQTLSSLVGDQLLGNPTVPLDEWVIEFTGTAKADKANNKVHTAFSCGQEEGQKIIAYLIGEIDAELKKAGIDPEG